MLPPSSKKMVPKKRGQQLMGSLSLCWWSKTEGEPINKLLHLKLAYLVEVENKNENLHVHQGHNHDQQWPKHRHSETWMSKRKFSCGEKTTIANKQ